MSALLLQRSSSQVCAREQLASLLHTSSSLSRDLQRSSRRAPSAPASSRTRLTSDLNPGTRSAQLEVAPRERKPPPRASASMFSRDSLPHANVPPATPRDERNFSFRRRSERRNEQDWTQRRGRWGAEKSDDRRPLDEAPRFGAYQERGAREGRAGRSSFGERSRERPDRAERRDAPTGRVAFGERGEGRRDSREQHNGRRSAGEGERRERERPQRYAQDRSEPKRPDFRDRDEDRPRRSFSSSGRDSERDASRRDTVSPAKIRNFLPPLDEFYHPPADKNASESADASSQQQNGLTTGFASPPLMPGLLACLTDILGRDASPTPIQSLSLKWLLDGNANQTEAPELGKAAGWKQFLLASETGSGKSIAYLLPLLQSLKQSEIQGSVAMNNDPQRALNPRALILAPTHELARQLSAFAKALLHEVKLRVLCASQANMRNAKEKRDSTTNKMMAQFEEEVIKSGGGGGGEFEVRKAGRFPVDLVVGTPMKLLEMVRGRGWDRKEDDVEESEEGEEWKKLRRGRDKVYGFGSWRSKPEMGLANVEWVVVDEADVLFDPDFQETTRQLLADISEARGITVPVSSEPSVTPSEPAAPTTTETQPIDYPFNLVLTSATIPSALATYLDKHHPKLMRLASPNLHHLPKTLQTEYVNWTGGNKFADIERRIRRVWAEDSSYGGLTSSRFSATDGSAEKPPLSKVLIFCNRSNKVAELGEYLNEKKIKNVALTSTSEHRKRGSNRHLDGFLRQSVSSHEVESGKADAGESEGSKEAGLNEGQPAASSNPKEDPHVMITTSLLSRGLDFSPSIRHVFIVDEPRNMIDFLHRAGRSGRAGERGKVVIFGKMKGRGSTKAKSVRMRVNTLV